MSTLALLSIAACGSLANNDTPVASRPPATQPTSLCSAAREARIRDLVAHLDDNADPLHSDYTPSVHALIGEDIPGACAVLEQLLDNNEATRLHASRVLEGVLMAHHGFRGGFGYTSEYGEEQVRGALQAIGYAYDAAAHARHAAAIRWRRWLEEDTQDSLPIASDGPSEAAMRSALTVVFPNLEQCGYPIDVIATFASSGNISSICRSGDTSTRDRACLAAAVEHVRVAPFQRASVWMHYSSTRDPSIGSAD